MVWLQRYNLYTCRYMRRYPQHLGHRVNCFNAASQSQGPFFRHQTQSNSCVGPAMVSFQCSIGTEAIHAFTKGQFITLLSQSLGHRNATDASRPCGISRESNKQKTTPCYAIATIMKGAGQMLRTTTKNTKRAQNQGSAKMISTNSSTIVKTKCELT